MFLPKNVENIILKLQSNGHQAFAVGGCVRDTLLGKEPKDWDICTSAMPEEIKAVFVNEKTIDFGMKHGTVSIVLDNEMFEVTTYRTDGEYLDNRHPKKVKFVSTIQQDLLRRDFTINAMAYNHADGLIDICGGEKDLKNKLIRTVGNPDIRFKEDALRIIRGLRFSASLNFHIECETENAIFKKKSLLKNISIERNNAEFTKIILSEHFAEILIKFKIVVAEFFPIINEISNDDIFFAESLTSDLALRLSALLKSIDFEVACYSVKSMRYPSKIFKSISSILANTHDIVDSEIALKKLLEKLGLEDCIRLLSVQGNSLYIEKAYDIIDEGECLTTRELNISGKELSQVGIKGKAIGETMNFLLDKVISGKINNEKSILLRCAKENTESK